MRRQVLALMLSLTMGCAGGPALAGCYEVIGCTDSELFDRQALAKLGCEQLYDVRNLTYKEHGYCFSTAKAIARFGNEGCATTNAEAIDLNEFEAANVASIRALEKAMGCK